MDDDEIVVQGLQEMLSPYSDRIEVATTALVRENATAQAIDAGVDIALLDLRYRGVVGYDQVATMLTNSAPFRVVVFSYLRDPRQVREAVDLGAAGYLLKSMNGADLADYLIRAHGGEVVIDPAISGEVGTRASRQERNWPGRELGITERESEVLGLLGEGLTNPQIASHLQIGEETVKTHLRRLFKKLGVTDRGEAVEVVRRNGMT